MDFSQKYSEVSAFYIVDLVLKESVCCVGGKVKD